MAPARNQGGRGPFCVCYTSKLVYLLTQEILANESGMCLKQDIG